MKKILLCSALAVLIMTFLSCKSTRILSATFESDAVNNPPATNLAGDPSGDVIQFDPGLAPQLEVKNSLTSGEKALHFMNVPVSVSSAHNRWLNFRGIATDLTNPLWFTYTAKNTNPSGDVLIDVSDGSAHLLARMRISSNGDVGLAKNILDNYTDIIGHLGDFVHTIIFTATPSTLQYNVTILQNGGPSITAEHKPMITDNALQFVNPAHPSISFQHASTGSGDHHYVIESVLISKKNPN